MSASASVDGELIVAVDGGGSKIDAVALSPIGELVAHASGPGSSPHLIGTAEAALVVDEVVRAVLGPATVPRQLSIYLSGLDLPGEIGAFNDAIADFAWAVPGRTVDNDLFALLRAGTSEPDAVAVVCGTGINAVGVRSDGATVRYPSLGMISGDWGGGWHLGEQALWHAARAADGRGPATALEAAVPAVFGEADVAGLIEALHFGRVPNTSLSRLSPTLFRLAAEGDEVALSLVERQAEEIAVLAIATLRRLELLERSVPIVLGGGVLASGDERLLGGVSARLAAAAPQARIEHVRDRPIVGAAMLALAAAGADSAAQERARAAIVGRLSHSA